MTTTLLGKVVITPRGAYNSATAYVMLDAVTYIGSSYLVLQPVTGVTPSNDGVNYQLLAAAGAAGANGSNGTNGANGTNGNTMLSTTGAPSNGVGNNGDFANDATESVMYGPKSAGVWPSGISYKGANGTNGAQQLNGINNQTGTSYTLVLGDLGYDVRCTNAANIALTIPPHSSVAFPVGALIVFSQGGAGFVTATAGAGVTINAANGVATTAQHDARVLEQTAIDVWRVW